MIFKGSQNLFCDEILSRNIFLPTMPLDYLMIVVQWGLDLTSPLLCLKTVMQRRSSGLFRFLTSLTAHSGQTDQLPKPSCQHQHHHANYPSRISATYSKQGCNAFWDFETNVSTVLDVVENGAEKDLLGFS